MSATGTGSGTGTGTDAIADGELHAVLAELVAAAREDASLAQYRAPVSAHQYMRLYRVVTRHLPRGSTVLDWGAGNGHFSYFLVRAGYRVSGFEFSECPRVCAPFVPHAYAFTKASANDPVSLPYEPATFDAVVSMGVLEHVRETGSTETASLREIHRVLAPGGRFFCFHLPNQYSWIEAAARGLRRSPHPYRYSRRAATALMAEAGFEVIEARRYGALPRNVWSWGVPRSVTPSFALARVYDGIDGALATVLAPVCQNHMLVARKP